MKWIITFFFIYAFPALADDCAKNRAVLEIGAYSTKLFQAEVDICQNKPVHKSTYNGMLRFLHGLLKLLSSM